MAGIYSYYVETRKESHVSIHKAVNNNRHVSDKKKKTPKTGKYEYLCAPIYIYTCVVTYNINETCDVFAL